MHGMNIKIIPGSHFMLGAELHQGHSGAGKIK